MGIREITVMEEPIHTPYMCIGCGNSKGDRPYFVDVGVNTELILENADTGLKHWTDGVVYFCNICMEDLFKEFNQKVFEFLRLRTEQAEAAWAADGPSLKAQAKEIKQLRAQLNELKAQLETTPEEVSDPDNETATEVLDKILGDTNGIDRNDGSESNVVNSDSEPAGDDQNPTGSSQDISSGRSNVADALGAIQLGTR